MNVVSLSISIMIRLAKIITCCRIVNQQTMSRGFDWKMASVRYPKAGRLVIRWRYFDAWIHYYKTLNGERNFFFKSIKQIVRIAFCSCNGIVYGSKVWNMVWSPWFSGWGRWLIVNRLWVRTPAPDTRWMLCWLYYPS